MTNAPDELDALLDGALDEFTRPSPAQVQVKEEQQEVDASAPFDLMAEMEKMLRDMETSDLPPPPSAPQPETAIAAEEASSFQHSINATMDRVKMSDAKIQSELKASSSSDRPQQDDDLMAEMMKQFGDLDTSEGFEGMMEEMMKQLLSKDVLYEPLQDLASKYPKWLDENRSKLDKDDIRRYEAQMEYCTQIMRLYDDSPEAVDEISALMQKMQECGAPPKEILADLAPGLDFGEDGMPALDQQAKEACPMQ